MSEPDSASKTASGGPTSAGRMNKRSGVKAPAKSRFRVEGGKEVSMTELCASVNKAVDGFWSLRRRQSERFGGNRPDYGKKPPQPPTTS